MLYFFVSADIFFFVERQRLFVQFFFLMEEFFDGYVVDCCYPPIKLRRNWNDCKRIKSKLKFC